MMRVARTAPSRSPACGAARTAGAAPRRSGKLTRADLPNGRNTIAFSGRIGRRALKPGAYKATLRARNAKGRSKPVAISFSIVK
jgi:hypothetical protein